MNRRLRAAFSVTLLFFTAAATAAPPRELLIVPGKRLGRVSLGPDSDKGFLALPEIYRADEGEYQRRLLWASHAPGGGLYTLYMHLRETDPPDGPVGSSTIDIIRVTSPRFITPDGLHVGSTLAQVRRRYPQARPVEGKLFIYDVERAGIAFEFARPPAPASRAIAVSIHPPGDPHIATARDIRRLLDQ